jgi:hypothetical protein
MSAVSSQEDQGGPVLEKQKAAHYPKFVHKMPCLPALMPTSVTVAPGFAGVLADGVLIAHLAFIVFVMLGGLLVLRWPKVVWLHVPAVLWGIYVEISGRICPLTPLENSLREAAGQIGYRGGFIEHYVTALIYPDGLSRSIQMVLAAVVITANATVYLLLIRKTRARTALKQP